MDALRILIAKRERILTLEAASGQSRAYPIALGRNAGVHKAVEGDHATPLGEFYICAKNPRSKFFLSLCLSYPNAEDAARGLREGLIDERESRQILLALAQERVPLQHTRLGGEIYIHGLGAPDVAQQRAGRDWTRGCIAVSNADIQEIYRWVKIGTPVTITE